MLLQAAVHRTGFCKSLSLWYLRTSKHEINNRINICYTFFIFTKTALNTAEDIYLSRPVCLTHAQCLYKFSYSGKSIHHLQGRPTAPGGGTHLLDQEVQEKYGCCLQSYLGTCLVSISPKLLNTLSTHRSGHHA